MSDKIKQLSDLDADLLRGLPADFTCSKNINGYTKLPNGLIIQWGRVEDATGNNGDYQVTFPITFPAACQSIVLSIDQGAAGSKVEGVGPSTATNTGFVFNAWTVNGPTSINHIPSNHPVYWLAIGY